MKDHVIRARIDAKLKAAACAALARCGLEPSDAIRMFLQQVVIHGGIPFAIQGADPYQVPGADLWAMKRASQVRDRALAASGQLADEDVSLVRSLQLEGAVIRWPAARLDD